MPSGLGHAPRALPAGTASGSFRAGHSSQLPEARRAHARLQIAAAAVRPWPWRSMTTETSIPSIREGIKLLISPDASPPATTRPSHASKQAQPTSVWHAVNLQQNSMTSAAGATLGTSSNAVEAFKVETPQQLQVGLYHSMLHRPPISLRQLSVAQICKEGRAGAIQIKHCFGLIQHPALSSMPVSCCIAVL